MSPTFFVVKYSIKKSENIMHVHIRKKCTQEMCRTLFYKLAPQLALHVKCYIHFRYKRSCE